MSKFFWIGLNGLLIGALVAESLFLLHVLFPAPVPGIPPKDDKIHVIDPKTKVELGYIDPKANKFVTAKGQHAEDAVILCTGILKEVETYHENFKADLLKSVSPEIKKKFETPKK